MLLLFSGYILLSPLNYLNRAEKLITKNKENQKEENFDGNVSIIEDLDNDMKYDNESKQFDDGHEDIPADECQAV